tara:strand:- start:45 stop:278 length:234 start_codon:yes stop_codon:yes gene_type:complete
MDGVFDGGGHRLFAQHVLTRVEGHVEHVAMGEVRRRDHERVDLRVSKDGLDAVVGPYVAARIVDGALKPCLVPVGKG